MSFISNIFSQTGTSIVEAVGDAIDKVVTSDEERMEKENEIAKASMQYEIEMRKLDVQSEYIDSKERVATEREVTKRWISDNNALMLQKLARPLTLYFLVISFILLITLDAFNAIELNETMFNGLKEILMIVIGAYFGFRTFEKIKRSSGWEMETKR